MPAPTYADIQIDLDPLDDASFRIRLRAPDGAESRVTFVLPADPAVAERCARFNRDDLNAAGAAALGQALFNVLFVGTARDLLARGLTTAEQRGQRPRLLLSLPRDAYAAAALPWELLHDAASTPLLRRGLAIVRRIPLDMATPPPLDAPLLRALLTAAPTNPPAEVERELAEVRAALATVADRVEVVVEAAITPAILQHRLREGFHAWHHVGHGRTDGSLILLDEGGDPVPITPTQVSGMLAGGAVRLTVVSACDSGRFDAHGGLVAAISDAGVPTLVAMQRAVTAEVTRAFAAEFYRALGDGWSVTAAVDEGRRAVLHQNDARPDWAIPVIFSRAPDDVLFVRPAPTAQQHADDLLAALPIDDDAPIPAPAPFLLSQRMPIGPNPLFLGRDADLRDLARQLKPQGGAVAVMTGIGGVGKTQLAAEFAHRYGRYFVGGVYWISFADPAGIAGQIAVYGGPGGLELFRDDDDLTLDERCARVQVQWASDLPRLVIFDNCDDASEFVSAEALLRRWKPGGGCRVLVTSRRATWSPTLGVTVHDIDTLARPASITLLKRLYPVLEPGEADVIAELLGDLPLAQFLAGNFLRLYAGRATTVDAFIARLRSPDLLHHAALQGRGTSDMPTEREPHVARAFALSVERLDPANDIDALARMLLARAALLAPGEPFPRALLLATVLDEDADEDARLQASDALQRLLDLGVLETETDDTLRIHRLIAAYAQQAVPDADALDVVEDALVDAGHERANSGYPSAVTPVVAQLRYAFARADTRGDARAAELANALARTEEMLVNYAAARPLYERALAIREQILGPTHPDTATSLNNLAYLLAGQGKYVVAQQLLERALSITEIVYGPDNAHCGAILCNLAELLRIQHQYESARKLLERALAIEEAQYGDYHPEVAAVWHNLAYVLQYEGDYAAARRCIERAITILEQTLGVTHPTTATSLSLFTELLIEQGDYQNARPLVERALVIRQQTLGIDHPETAGSQMLLAELLRAQEDIAGARALADRALATLEERLNPDHPYLATSLYYLAKLRKSEGNLAAAAALFERSLGIRRQMLGPSHPDIARSESHLALLLQFQGDYVGARRLFEHALDIRQQTLGPMHPDIADSLNHLALLLTDLGDYQAARPLYVQALTICEQVWGPVHTRTAAIISNLAYVLSLMEENNLSLTLLERALKIFEQTTSTEHPQIVPTLQHIATIYEKQGNFAKARPLLEHNLAVCERTLGPTHPDTATSLNNLAVHLAHRHDFDQAFPLIERALAIREQVLGSLHPDTIRTQESLANMRAVAQQRTSI